MGVQDYLMSVLSNAGNKISDKVFGGSSYEKPCSIVPYLSCYAATGNCFSNTFSEGTVYGNFTGSGGAAITYISMGTVGIEDISKDGANQLKLYPNPASTVVRVIVPDDSRGSIEILNSIGQVLYKEKIGSVTAYRDVEINDYAEGMYLLRWQGEDGRMCMTKFVKY